MSRLLTLVTRTDRIFPVVRIVAIVGLIVAAMAASSDASGATPDPRCAFARALRQNGQPAAAVEAYIALLKNRPNLACAQQGLRLLSAAAERRQEQRLLSQCHAAKRLAAKGEREEAKSLYIGAAKKGGKCGADGLDALERSRPRKDVWKDRLGTVTAIAGLVAVPLLVVLLLLALVYAILTYIGPLRRLWRDVPLLGQPVRPRLKVGKFADAGTTPTMGESVAAVVRSGLSRLGREQGKRGDYRLDSVTGAEGIETTVARLGELAPQFKVLSAILGFTGQIARSSRYELYGTVQAPRASTQGITASLDRTRGEAATSTLWDQSPSDGDQATRLYYLATVTASWADFRLRQRESLELPEGTSSAESYGHFRAGVVLERERELSEAFNAYREALVHDNRNVAALLNLARLEGRGHHYASARRLLDRAVVILEQEIDG